jgi:hypothetical protein
MRDGRVVEDWTATDGIELLRALGVLRAAPRLLRMLQATRPR